MTRWFRHYAGMMRDDKLVRAALRAKQPIERVVWVWGCILESAAEIDDGGRYEIDHAEMAYFLRTDESDVAAVEDALRALGRVDEGVVAHWQDRQFQSDRSAERQKRYRERHKGADHSDEATLRDAGVTSPSRHRDAPDTETELDTDSSSLRSEQRGARDVRDFKNALPELDTERLKALVKHRRSKRGQITGHAARLFRRDAEACGLSVVEATDTCISRNWITVKPEYFTGRQRAGPAPPKQNPIRAVIANLSAEMEAANADATGKTEGHRPPNLRLSHG